MIFTNDFAIRLLFYFMQTILIRTKYIYLKHISSITFIKINWLFYAKPNNLLITSNDEK